MLGDNRNILFWDTLAEAQEDAKKVAELHPGTPVFVYEMTEVYIK